MSIDYPHDSAKYSSPAHETNQGLHYRPASLRAKQLREKREMEESKYEVADDLAFAELISYASVGVDPFQAHENHEARPFSTF